MKRSWHPDAAASRGETGTLSYLVGSLPSSPTWVLQRARVHFARPELRCKGKHIKEPRSLRERGTYVTWEQKLEEAQRQCELKIK